MNLLLHAALVILFIHLFHHDIVTPLADYLAGLDMEYRNSDPD